MRRAALLLTIVLALSACGDDAAAACTELREPQDPASGQHVLSAGSVIYETDPPTSGPHIAGPTPSSVLANPVDPAIQVRLLEAGGVMIQYDDTIDPALLAPLGDELVVVAPTFGELPAPVVATAWTWKLSCSEVDTTAIREFIERRPADAPGLD